LHPEPLRLRAIPLFADLGPDDLYRVASWLEIREESEGRRLTPEGASGYEFFVIEDGTAEVHLEGAKVGSLGPGDFFGEMAMMGTDDGSPTSSPPHRSRCSRCSGPTSGSWR
jgi:CRP-like cAMP-binding protein